MVQIQELDIMISQNHLGGAGVRKARSNMLEFFKDVFEIQNQDYEILAFNVCT